MSDLPSLSTDQLAALAELARSGSLRAAAEALHISEQGARNRLVALEQRLGVELYHKSRGLRRRTPLTRHGRRLLPHVLSLLERCQGLAALVHDDPSPSEVHVAASQYLIAYVLIDAVRDFHRAHPEIRVRLSARTEQEIEETLLQRPDVSLGVAAPYEWPAELSFRQLFSMDWSLIAPPRHRLLRRRRLRLADLPDEPLVVYEHGSTGRQHVMEAFQQRGLTPRIEMEATNTDLIVRMVEAQLGVALVPLLPNGAVTRGRRVESASLGRQIRPIHSGILTRAGETPPPAAQEFVRFVQQRF